jgi:ribosomal protein S18 acetylase RimI-like enzyme
MTVREANASDIPSLKEFILAAWKESGPKAWGWTGATEESIHELASEGYLQRLLSNPKVKMLLAKDGGYITGFAANRTVDTTTVELAGIIISERFTGKGIGTALMKASMERASKAGFEEMTVKTESFNSRAIGFYEANGFHRVGLESEEVGGNNVELVVLKRGLGI